MTLPTEPEGFLPGVGRNESLQRAFDILEIIAESDGGASVARLSSASGLPRTTVARLLASLFDVGAVARPGTRRSWVLGPTISRLHRASMNVDDIQEQVVPLLERITEELGETSFAAIPIGPVTARVIAEAPGPKIVGVTTSWATQALTSPASGFVRTLLAEMSEEDAALAIKKLSPTAHTSKTKVSAAEIIDAVSRIRGDGFSEVVDELEDGLAGLGVPVRRSGVLIAMISVYLPTARLTPRVRARALEVMRLAAADLGR